MGHLAFCQEEEGGQAGLVRPMYWHTVYYRETDAEKLGKED
jgi:hypothetical protein